jgi:hypothetical protein
MNQGVLRKRKGLKKEIPVTGSSLEKIVFDVTKGRQKEA